jgi:SAM-dependent methyltransferase
MLARLNSTITRLARHPWLRQMPGRSFAGRIWRHALRVDAGTPPTADPVGCLSLVAQKVGLEIGGPSALFAAGAPCPVYPHVKRLDNCNFAHQTVWEPSLREGMNFQYDDNHSPGHQFIREATDLHDIPNGSYDFILSSHNIEHIANPLRALQEWRRVLKPVGAMVLVVPHRDGTFDHNRPVTTLAHLIEDLQNGVGEDDLTHLPEILALHDLSMDIPAGDIENFRKRSERNLENRCLHQHVFDTALALAVANWAGLQIRSVRLELPYHIIVAGQWLPAGRNVDNSQFLGPSATYRRYSPFPTDRAQPRGESSCES